MKHKPFLVEGGKNKLGMLSDTDILGWHRCALAHPRTHCILAHCGIGFEKGLVGPQPPFQSSIVWCCVVEEV
jgi:hypothetical protein